jgi:hypothetical protein
MGKDIKKILISKYDEHITFHFLMEYKGGETETDEFDHPYKYEVLYNVDENTEEIESLTITGVENLIEVMDKDDCLPDIGLINCKDEELNIDIKNVTLKELLKEIFKNMK